MRPTSVLGAAALVLGLCVAPASADPVAPDQRIDVSSVKIAHTHKRIVMSLAYAQAPSQTQWVGTVLFDTNRARKGPEFVASFDNQCGRGYTFGRAKRSGDSWRVDPADKRWVPGCGATARCLSTLRVGRDASGFLRRIVLVKKKGCVTAQRARVSVRITSLDLADRDSTPWHDDAPGKRNAFTSWVRPGRSVTFADRT